MNITLVSLRAQIIAHISKEISNENTEKKEKESEAAEAQEKKEI